MLGRTKEQLAFSAELKLNDMLEVGQNAVKQKESSFACIFFSARQVLGLDSQIL